MAEGQPHPFPSTYKHNFSLRTARLHIRSIRISDAAAIASIRSNRAVYQWTTSGEQTPSQVEDWIRTNLDDPTKGNWVVELLPEHAVAERSGAERPEAGRREAAHPATQRAAAEQSEAERSKAEGREGGRRAAPEPPPSSTSPLTEVVAAIGTLTPPEIGFMFSPKHWRRGYASELLPPFLREFFERTRYGHVHARADPENTASRRLLERCGFSLTKIQERAFENPTLGWRAVAYYRIERGVVMDASTAGDKSTEAEGLVDGVAVGEGDEIECTLCKEWGLQS